VVGGQRYIPHASPPGKRPVTRRTGGWLGTRTCLHGTGKFLPHRECFPSHKFLLFLFCTFSVHVSFVSIVLALCFPPPHPRLYNSHNTNIHAPGGIRNNNTSKRAAADRSATGIGFDPPAVQTVAVIYPVPRSC
jgi:hypothetical protein